MPIYDRVCVKCKIDFITIYKTHTLCGPCWKKYASYMGRQLHKMKLTKLKCDMDESGLTEIDRTLQKYLAEEFDGNPWHEYYEEGIGDANL